MNFNIHLSFNGNCEEAFRSYAACLGGEITALVTYGVSPLAAQYPELADRILHATLMVGQNRLSGVDVSPSRYEKPGGFTIQLNLDSVDDATRIYEALAVDGKLVMPLQKTFWAALFGVLTDRFGTPWEINCSGTSSA